MSSNDDKSDSIIRTKDDNPNSVENILLGIGGVAAFFLICLLTIAVFNSLI